MAREYAQEDAGIQQQKFHQNVATLARCSIYAALTIALFGPLIEIGSSVLFLVGGVIPACLLAFSSANKQGLQSIEGERLKESKRRGGKDVLGLPPKRDAFSKALKETRAAGKVAIDKYLVGFELDTGEPMWIGEDDLCTHACVFAKTGVGKTLWLEGLMFQQMARGRASGLTFIDAKRDPGTLADIIMMALITGRIEDLLVVDPFDPVNAYNFVFTSQRADVKARKILRCGLPPTSDASPTKHYDRLASDAVYRVVRALESFGLAWSVKDIAVALSAFQLAYPRIRDLLNEKGENQAMVELGHLASTYRSPKGQLDAGRITENLRGIASELHSISNSEAGDMFTAPRADLALTDAILRGKIIYYMLPRLEEAESADRMVKVFREDLEVSIGEITSSRHMNLEDPHMIIIDEGASTFGPTWANLFELARKGRFALLFGAQSVSGLMDQTMGLSEEFYQRVIANVNLKVIMRLGDNKTAMDMSEWIGKVVKTKKSYGVGLSSGVSHHELTKHLEFNRRASDAQRQAVTVAEDETDLVSPEELKHEMGAEKGLAWFDLGDGRLRKGRSIWFQSDLPSTWEGREFLPHYEGIEGDEIGLAEWVDQFILNEEQQGSAKNEARPPASSAPSKPASTQSPKPQPEAPKEVEDKKSGGAFRFNIMGKSGPAKAKTFEKKKEKPKVEVSSGKVGSNRSGLRLKGDNKKEEKEDQGFRLGKKR